MARLPRRRAPLRRHPPAPPSLMVLGDLLLDVVARADAGLRPGSDVQGTVRFRRGRVGGQRGPLVRAAGWHRDAGQRRRA